MRFWTRACAYLCVYNIYIFEYEHVYIADKRANKVRNKLCQQIVSVTRETPFILWSTYRVVSTIIKCPCTKDIRTASFTTGYSRRSGACVGSRVLECASGNRTQNHSHCSQYHSEQTITRQHFTPWNYSTKKLCTCHQHWTTHRVVKIKQQNSVFAFGGCR